MFSMFTLKNIHDLTCLLVVLCILRLSMAEDWDFLDEFLKREYSLMTPYRGFSSPSSWELKGTALVATDYVRLTPDLPNRQGAIWSGTPLQLHDWELKVHFKIHGKAKTGMSGDGLAIWLTKERMQDGPVFGSRNKFTGLGVFVDTYPNSVKNDRVFPYVSVMLGNGALSYEHDSDGQPTELAGCSSRDRNSRDGVFLRIRYIKNRLMVMLDVDGKDIWKNCVNITGIHLPTGYYLGASSATGDLSDNHDIISMKLYELIIKKVPEHIPKVDDKEEFQVEIQVKQISEVRPLTYLFTFLFLCALVVGGSKVYRHWEENKRKRSY
ncbi:lectin, mannose-binding 2-like b [Festucalex cinctus]